jgi:hypothetical protein
MIGKLEAQRKRHIEKHSFVNRTIQLWNHLPANVLGNLSCNQVILGKGLGT